VDTDGNGNTDNDGDALCDNWETTGIDFDGDGTVDLQLYDVDGDGTIQAGEQADLNHKDIYMEIDWMAQHQPNQNSVNDVIASFANSTVPNPDGTPGIRLHIQTDEQAVAHNNNLAFEPCTAPATGSVPDYDTVKSTRFGTATERADANSVNILNAKRFASHYTLFAHNLNGLGGTSGCAELPGNDFVVSLGSWTSVGGHGVGNRDEQAGTLMHEFGHNLDLRHGGGDNINYKPNYLSIMSYARQIDGWFVNGRPLDYSDRDLPTLVEGNLSEPAGIGGAAGDETAFGPPPIQMDVNASGAIDWNLNGVSTDTGVSRNINNFGGSSGAGTNLEGYDDWDNLQYNFRATIDFADGIHLTTLEVDEVDLDEMIAANTPPVADAGGPYTTDEGVPVTVDASGSTDPDSLIASYEWDLDYDLQYDDATGVTAEMTYWEHGSYTIGLKVTDAFGASDTDTAQVTVVNVPPSMNATPPSQQVQYSDPLMNVTITAQDVAADPLTLTGTSWSKDGGGTNAGLPTGLSLSLVSCGVSGNYYECSWTLSGIADLDPGAYVVYVTVEDDDGAVATLGVNIDVLPEDARTTYTGPMLVSTSCADCSEATIPLRATIQDISALPADPDYDAYPGEITYATVEFVDRDTSDVLCTASLVLLDPADPLTASAFCDWEADIGNNDGVEFTVGIIVNGRYYRDRSFDDTVVTVFKPGPDFITGGGYLVNQNSDGEYGGDTDLKTNFGFTVKFNKKGTKLQGRVTIIVRQGGHVYRIKSNALASLVVVPYDSGDPLSGVAEFYGKANVQDVTDPDNPIGLEGNATLHMTMKDNGEPGSSDTIGITLWSKQGDLLFSSIWTGVETVEQILDGGNLHVH
jgi:hypothetical protein